MRSFFPRLLKEMQCSPPSLVTLFLGANDAVESSKAQHVPLNEFTDNLKAMLSLIQKEFPDCALILITPPAIAEKNSWDRTNERAGLYADACVDLGKRLNVPVCNVWAAMQPEKESYLSDGLHLNANGNHCVYQLLSTLIAEHWPLLTPTALPFGYPDWKDHLPPFESSSAPPERHVKKRKIVPES
jgi:lysophospholipase L1-like esterase